MSKMATTRRRQSTRERVSGRLAHLVSRVGDMEGMFHVAKADIRWSPEAASALLRASGFTEETAAEWWADLTQGGGGGSGGDGARAIPPGSSASGEHAAYGGANDPA